MSDQFFILVAFSAAWFLAGFICGRITARHFYEQRDADRLRRHQRNLSRYLSNSHNTHWSDAP